MIRYHTGKRWRRARTAVCGAALALGLGLPVVAAAPAGGSATGSGTGPATQATKPAQPASTRSAAGTIKYLHARLIQVMKQAKSLGYPGRYRVLKPVIEQTHDLRYMAWITLGSHWNTLSKQQQASFVSTFARLTIATYAGRFDGYSGERFEFGSSQKLSADQRVVRSQLIESDGKKVSFDYVLRQDGEHWKIINIVVNGVSELALKRAEYGDLLQRQGFTGLIKKLDSKIAAYGGSP